MNESSYLEGRRRAWLNMLQICLKELGIDDPAAAQARWVMERQETIAQLRMICAKYDDLDLPDDGYIPDILENHLYDHLQDDEPGE